MYYTYVLRSKKNGRWYTGATDDLRKRLIEHNDNQVRATKGRGPFSIIYYEACINKQDAFIREKYLKSGMGKRFLKNRLKRFLSLTGQVRDGVHPDRGRLPVATVSSNRGFSTLEILIAMTILVMCISAVILVSFSNQSMLISSQINSEALNMAQELLEKAQADARNDFASVESYPVVIDEIVDGFTYHKSVVVEQPDSFTKKVIAVVSWTGEGNKDLNIQLTALVTDFENATP